MPHECANCSHVIEDGTEKLLEGCPECDSRKFQYRAKESIEKNTPENVSEQHGTPTKQQVTSGKKEPVVNESPVEDEAQTAARREITSPSNLPNVSPWPTENGSSDEEPVRPTPENDSEPVEQEAEENEENPPEDPYEREAWEEKQKEQSIENIKEELNRQFESIRIMSPGEYKLDLMELYESDDHIIALQEDGKYMIEVPEYRRS